MPLIACQNLSLGYDGNEILENLSFIVEPGNYLCIVGENGAGKTTLIKTLLGLIPPISGRILTGDGLKQNQIGYLPQQTDAQKDFPASVKEIVISGCQSKCGLRPFYSKAEKTRADGAMEKLNIANIRRRRYSELSGGQQQRVLLARALCAAEKLLLLDEPTASLDPKAAADFYQMIYELNRGDKITIIMISHDIAAALKYASHILDIGSAAFFGTKREYLQNRDGYILPQTETN